MMGGEVIELNPGLEESSPYFLGDNVLSRLPQYLRRHDFDRSFLVTSQKLWGMFGGTAVAALREANIRCEPILVPESESNKRCRASANGWWRPERRKTHSSSRSGGE
jgi:glycerol dehydrogenase-like iron-containing ADH family enzyme